MTGERESLSAELEAALLRELREAWRTESWARFGQKLRMPTFELSELGSTLGRWARERRTIVRGIIAARASGKNQVRGKTLTTVGALTPARRQ